MTVDVFHHHDGIVHQDPNGKHQCEEGNTVQCIAKKITDKDSKCQCYRNGDEDDHSFPDTQCQENQQCHDQGGCPDVEHQFIRLFLCCFPVVTGVGDLHLVRYQDPLQLRHDMFDFFGNDHGVSTLAFDHGQGDCGIQVPVVCLCALRFKTGSDAKENVVRGFFRAIDNFGNFFQKYWSVLVNTHDQLFQVFPGLDKSAGFDHD